MQAGCKIELIQEFLGKDEADRLFEETKLGNISEFLNWEDEIIKMYGKTIKCPRKTAFLGERAGLVYRYSGKQKTSVQWSPLVEEIKNRIELICNQKFNVVLLNWYQNGNDYIGYHSDNEKDLKGNKIASLSLGAGRHFLFQHKKTSEVTDFWLESGDLLIMSGETQKHYKHALPKSSVCKEPRLNFTFRLVDNKYLS